MGIATDHLPDDVETLQRLLREQATEIAVRKVAQEAQAHQIADQAEQLARQEVALKDKGSEIYGLRLMIEKLKLQIARFKRMQFGRRSEQHDAHVAQLELIVDELEINLAARVQAQGGSEAT